MRNEEILTEVDRRFADQKQLIEAKFTHLSAIIQNGFEAGEHERRSYYRLWRVQPSILRDGDR